MNFPMSLLKTRGISILCSVYAWFVAQMNQASFVHWKLNRSGVRSCSPSVDCQISPWTESWNDMGVFLAVM